MYFQTTVPTATNTSQATKKKENVRIVRFREVHYRHSVTADSS